MEEATDQAPPRSDDKTDGDHALAPGTTRHNGDSSPPKTDERASAQEEHSAATKVDHSPGETTPPTEQAASREHASSAYVGDHNSEAGSAAASDSYGIGFEALQGGDSLFEEGDDLHPALDSAVKLRTDDSTSRSNDPETKRTDEGEHRQGRGDDVERTDVGDAHSSLKAGRDSEPSSTITTAKDAHGSPTDKESAERAASLVKPESSGIHTAAATTDPESVPAAGAKRPAPAPTTPMAAFSWNDILRVQNLIERCLQQYLSKTEILTALQSQAGIDPAFADVVWQKLEEQNPSFFRAYHIQLRLKEQIVAFNYLVAQQKDMMAKSSKRQRSTNSPSTADSSYSPSTGVGSENFFESSDSPARSSAQPGLSDFGGDSGRAESDSAPLPLPLPLPLPSPIKTELDTHAFFT